MDALLIGLMLIVAVLLSNLLSKLLPQVSTPLVQIALGMVMALFLRLAEDFELPTNLFMVLFVAPLVYADSRGIDRVVAWHNRKTILVLSIGLVITTTVSVGVTMGAAVDLLTFPVAFVLGSALSPTDAVAVPSLAHTSSIDKRNRTVLTAESIVNDATGVVVFNLALAALVSGSFAIEEAGLSFVVLFFGGIALGLGIGVAGNALFSLASRLGYDDVGSFMLFDLALPFMTFLAGEVLGVSPIMAVMACALMFKSGGGAKYGPEESRMNIVSSSVWSVASFVLNGFVFVILGFQLVDSFKASVAMGVSGMQLVGMAALLVCLVTGVRYLWLLVMERSSAHPFRSAGVLAFAGGVKGAVTMSVALSIPYAVSSRSLVIFLVSVVIIASTLIANVVVPILAPAVKQTQGERAEALRLAKIDILRKVVARLNADRTKENGPATRLVIGDYNKRIRELSKRLLDSSDVARRAVRLHALDLETERCTELMESGEVDPRDGYRYLMHVSQLKAALTHRTPLPWILQRNLRRIRGMMRAAWHARTALLGGESEPSAGVRGLQRRCSEYVVKTMLDELPEGLYPIEDVTQVVMEYRHALELMSLESPSITTIASREVQSGKIKLRAVGYELEAIREAQDEGKISREEAMALRDDAYLMRIDLEGVV